MSSTEPSDDTDVELTDTNLDDVFEEETEANKTSEETEASEALDAFSAAPPPPVKRGVGWGAVLPLFILAAAGGAAGGWALTQYVMPNYIALPQSVPASQASDIDLEALTARLEAAEKKLSANSSQLSFLSSEVKSGAATVKVGGVDKAFDVSPLLSRIDALEAQLNASNTSGAANTAGTSVSGGTSDAPKLSGAKDTLEASRPAASANDAPAAFTDSLEAFETRLVVLEKSFAEVATLSETESQMLEGTPEEMAAAEEARAAREARYDTLKAELETMRARVSRLETDITATQALAAEPTIVRETVLLPPLPREALLEALTAPRDTESQGWLNRTLKKHISVRNPQEVARANATLDEIETLTAARDYAAALKLVEAMPSDVRSLASEWTRAVKAEVQTP